MTRSPLTLAASVTAALPGVAVVGAASLSSDGEGRFAAALVTLDDGRRVVVRAPVDDDTARELAAEALALRALTPGARALLPFRAPEFLGEIRLSEGSAVVVDFLAGYRVEAADIPAGRGAASSIGESLASLHALPVSVVRAEGLPRRNASDIRSLTRALVERAAATHRLPVALQSRWGAAIDDDDLWRFETRVILGEAGASSFVFDDIDDVPTVVGILGWHGLAVGDPASDLHWLASAPEAIDHVYDAYLATSDRGADAELRTRARLYAELEFAKWLVHGHEQRRDDIVEDAVELLDALVAGLGAGAQSLRPVSPRGVDDALAVIAAGTPVAESDSGAEPSTSMQTDAYDPSMLSLFEAADLEHADDGERATQDHRTSVRENAHAEPRLTHTADIDRDAHDPTSARDEDASATDDAAVTSPASPASAAPASPAEAPAVDADETAPIDLSEWSDDQPDQTSDSMFVTPTTDESSSESDEDELRRASRAAIQRWANSSSE